MLGKYMDGLGQEESAPADPTAELANQIKKLNENMKEDKSLQQAGLFISFAALLVRVFK